MYNKCVEKKKIGSGTQKLMGRGIQIAWRTPKPTFIFQNKECGLKQFVSYGGLNSRTNRLRAAAPLVASRFLSQF
jgi:hypothetical protein